MSNFEVFVCNARQICGRRFSPASLCTLAAQCELVRRPESADWFSGMWVVSFCGWARCYRRRSPCPRSVLSRLWCLWLDWSDWVNWFWGPMVIECCFSRGRRICWGYIKTDNYANLFLGFLISNARLIVRMLLQDFFFKLFCLLNFFLAVCSIIICYHSF